MTPSHLKKKKKSYFLGGQREEQANSHNPGCFRVWAAPKRSHESLEWGNSKMWKSETREILRGFLICPINKHICDLWFKQRKPSISQAYVFVLKFFQSLHSGFVLSCGRAALGHLCQEHILWHSRNKRDPGASPLSLHLHHKALHSSVLPALLQMALQGKPHFQIQLEVSLMRHLLAGH